jgi:membrane protease YdiL (CAAX protease family)
MERDETRLLELSSRAKRSQASWTCTVGAVREDDHILQPAVATLEAGGRIEARHALEKIVSVAPNSEQGWLWLAEAVDTDEERRFCLARAFSINRRNALARRGLEALGPGPARSPLGEHSGHGVQDTRPEPPVERSFWTSMERLRARGQVQAVREAFSNRPILIALAYLGAIALAETLTVIFAPLIGLLLHGVLLITLFCHTALTWGYPAHRLWLTLTFAPLIRLLSLSLPLSGFSLIYWYFFVSVPLFVAAFAALRTLGFSWNELGVNLGRLPLQVLVACTGLSLGYIEYRILQPAPMARSLTWEELWLPGLILVICTGFAEELIFRGIMHQTAAEVLGRVGGILYVSALFAVLHVGYHSLVDVVFVFGVALFFGLTRAFTGSIVGVSLAHGITNVLLFLTMPLGMNPFDLIAHHLHGI